ncbi:hypothetical protein BJ508DRAFT_363079 [Ascobolus immersus RN42]|uniref:DUF3835 domain-containing protein n=1 Tax=Ascobolus immersus RN42 TaxID=1160509 RepID=A0A3N4I4S5_ASCIM|nr:hypothetical protein BJ508DRAFT_363079 [Ascobolus immersus RN42]
MSDPDHKTTEERLQASLDKLRQAHTTFLIHSAEYSAFIEEITPLDDDASYEELLDAGRRFGGTLVDEKDVVSVLGGKGTGIRRGKEAVIRALERRLDWMNDNIKKVQRQIELAETALIEGHEVGEDELPSVDVTEEVDEEGNVLESVIREGGTVRKIDVKDVPDFVSMLQKVGKEGDKKIEANKAGGVDEHKVLASSPKPDTPPITKAIEKESVLPKEEVKEDIKRIGTARTDLLDSIPLKTESPDSLSRPEQVEKKVERIEEIVDQEVRIKALQAANAAPAPKKKRDLSFSDSEDESDVEEVGHVPPGWRQTNPNDTEEEARLRREMLKYNISEINPIVAELNIEEASDDDYDDDGYDFDTEDEEDEVYEDEHGRTTKRMVTDELKEEMARLQAKIAAREGGPEETKEPEPIVQARNAGPMQPHIPSVPKFSTNPTDTPAPALKSPTPPPAGTPTPEKKSKSVRFNNTLDVSPAPPHVEPLPSPPAQKAPVDPNLPTLDPDQEDAIPFLVQLLEQSELYKNKEIPGLDHLEGTELEVEKPIVRKPKQKGPSLFKKTRQQGEATEKSEEKPAGIVKDKLVERSAAVPPTPPQPRGKGIVRDTLVERPPVPPTAPSPPKAKGIVRDTLVERPPVPPTAPSPPKKAASPIVSEKLVERPPQPATPPTIKAKKLSAMNPLLPPPEGHPLSRFRSLSAIEAIDDEEPDRSNQPLVSKTIVEKPPVKVAAKGAIVPNEYDLDIQRSEVAQKLVQLQSKVARREGGVLNPGEREFVELDEDTAPQGSEQAGKKRVSKFKQMRKAGI